MMQLWEVKYPSSILAVPQFSSPHSSVTD